LSSAPASEVPSQYGHSDCNDNNDTKGSVSSDDVIPHFTFFRIPLILIRINRGAANFILLCFPADYLRCAFSVIMIVVANKKDDSGPP
jgi:hypothetical protein